MPVKKTLFMGSFFGLFVHLAIFSSHTSQENKKYVIGCHVCGFFANFVAVINKLDMCEKNNLTPVIYWDSKSCYYQKDGFNGSYNVWEYFFEPSSHLHYVDGDSIDRQTSLAKPFLINPGNCMPNQAERLRAYELITKYMPLKPFVKETITEFRQKHMSNDFIIGLHLRGTDKIQEVRPVNPQKIFDAANSFAISCKRPVKFFVASDEQRLIDLAQTALNGKVINYPSERSIDGNPIHLTKRHEPAIAALDVLVETILLSSCDIVFHTISNVAKGILMFNPYLKNICLEA